MIWVRRIIIPAVWNEVEDQFERLFVKLGCPGQMMLVATSGSGPLMLFASLPNPALLNALAEFERMSDDELPAEASLLGLAPERILLANSLCVGAVEAWSAFRLQGLGFRPGGFHVAPPNFEW